MSGPAVRIVDVAGVAIALAGDHTLIDLVHSEIPADPRVVPRGYVTVTTSPIDVPAGGVTLGPVSVGFDQLRLDFEVSALTLGIGRPPLGEPFTAVVAVGERPMRYGLPRPLFRWLEPSFLGPLQAQAYVFLHLVLESLVLLGTPLVPLHAAVLERNGRALALTSSGGVGKTTTAMHMIRTGRWSFLSDDMTMLEPGQPIRPYARLPMVYEYNVHEQPELRKVIAAVGGTASRVQWAVTRPIHRSKRRRRVPVESLYGRDVLGRPAELDLVAFLVRHGRSSVEVYDLDASEVARRSTAIVALEFSHLLDRLRLAEAAGADALVAPLLDRCHSTYLEAFQAGVQLCEVRIPQDGAPVEEVVDVLENRFET